MFSFLIVDIANKNSLYLVFTTYKPKILLSELLPLKESFLKLLKFIKNKKK